MAIIASEEHKNEVIKMISEIFFDAMIETDLERDLPIIFTETNTTYLSYIKNGDSFEDAIEIISEHVLPEHMRADIKKLYNKDSLREGFKKGRDLLVHTIFQQDAGGDYRYIKYISKIYRSKFSDSIRMLTFIKNNDEEARATNQLKLNALTDPLTGLNNRKAVMDRIKNCVENKEAFDSHALMFVDIDRFKLINDTLGHPCGDKLLKSAAQKMNSVFRETDLIGRVGGDEFLILLKHVKEPFIVREKAEALLESISGLSDEINSPVQISCSIGISLYEGDGTSFDKLYERADTAMYRAKRAGRNKAEFY